MGCGGSSAADGAAGGMGRPGGKQGQDAAKDAAASEIQGAAADFLKAKKLEADRDAAAQDIQNNAAAFLAKKRSEKEMGAAPAALIPIKLDEVAKNIGDGIAEISHRIFGGDKKEDKEEDKPKLLPLAEGASPEPATAGKWERPTGAATVEASAEMQYGDVVAPASGSAVKA